ncbi:LysR family transcriptional regulator [Nocardioides dilutus]
MDLERLRSFVVLAEQRHFGRAAQQLRIAQPALSRQLQVLEREAGTALVLRSTRSFELTEAGELLLGRARQLLDDVRRTQEDLRLVAQGRMGVSSVGFVGTATYDLLPRVARLARAELPDLDLHVHGELLAPDLVDGLLDRTYDVAVTRPVGPGRGILTSLLRRERLVAVLPAHHRLADRQRIALRDLAGETFVMHPLALASSLTEAVLAACSREGFTPPGIVEVTETSTLVVSVAAGLGVAVVPQPVRTLRLDGVSYVSLREAPSIDLCVAVREDDARPSTGRVADLIGRSIH